VRLRNKLFEEKSRIPEEIGGNKYREEKDKKYSYEVTLRSF
jgi:hypothetical protein